MSGAPRSFFGQEICLYYEKSKKRYSNAGNVPCKCKGLWLCQGGRSGEGSVHPGGANGDALDGDLVEVRLLPSFDGNVIPDGKDGRRQEAEVIRVVARNTTSLVGTFYGKGGSGSVIPDNRKIPADVRIPEGCSMGAVNGHKVVVFLTDF